MRTSRRPPVGGSRVVFGLVCGWLGLLLVVPLLALVITVAGSFREVAAG